MGTLADNLEELDRDLARLRRHSAPTTVSGRIWLAVAEAELLGGYVREVAKTLAALRGAGAGLEKASERGQRDLIRSDPVHPGQ